MQPLSEDRGPWTWAIKRGLVSHNPEQVSWQCPSCGLVPPLPLSNGWYARRLCACRTHALEEQRRQSRQTLHHQQLMAQVYGWLGKNWSQEGLEDKTFLTFDWHRQPEGYARALSFAKQPSGVLYLYGGYGTGKTHLLAAIANQQCATGQTSLFTSVVTLFDALGDRIHQGEDYHALLRRAIATPLLILDDLDKPKSSDFRLEILYQIVDGRNRAKRPLALSGNCPPGGLAALVGGATHSRLMQGMVPVLITVNSAHGRFW